ncbi:substrate-binding domain-containing protein [uncultured Paenibacillus sp.]|uniref:LacI family DNA-binding transcriptional regulator n=1 Tax=uncultured Paenibacillus sp. TaxID=227322 RepID=UPI0015AF459F|nr:substrate-binding domain-containing protein [uncultured Paenibacillus sp.]
MATIKDVAEMAGVSIATVSRMINQNGYVSKKAEQRIMEAMERLDYEPLIFRRLADHSMPTIALILPDITNPFFSELARAVEDICQQRGYTVFFCNSDNQDYKEKSYLEALRKRRIDGIIYASNYLTQEELNKLGRENIPVVVLDRSSDTQKCTLIRCNNYEGAQMAVKHLLDIGCRKIAHIYGPQEIVTAQERLNGYEDYVKSFSWYTPSLMAPGHFQLEGGMQAVETLLLRHPDIDGIFAGNDFMAIGALKALHRKGIKVPDDIAVCGFDGIKLAEIIEPELTTIAQPIYEMGEKAARILIKQIEARDTRFESEMIEINVSLIIRDSTRRDSEK